MAPPYPAQSWPPRPARAPLLLLLLSAGLVAPHAVAVPEARARAGVAGGAGAAELAELTEREVVNGTLAHADGALRPEGGTIREALGGGVVEHQQVDDEAAGQGVQEDQDGSTRTRSRCISPQVCLRVEQCPPSPGEDVLFECATGRACCLPNVQPQLVAYPPPPSVAATTAHPPPRPAAPTAHPPPRPAPPATHSPPRPAHPTAHPPPRPAAPVPAPPPSLPQHGGHPVSAGDRTSTKTTTPATPRSTTPKPTSTPASLLPGTDTCGKVLTENRITNGKIASLGQFPWMALLGYNRRGSANVTFLCGGTLINERYVLTAAHCISSQNRPAVVRLGEFNLTQPVDCDHNNVCAPPPLDIPVEHVIPHPDFDIRNIKHDIALLRLRRSVTEYSDFVRPICLPLGINVTDEKKFKIAGWGKTDFKDAGGSVALQFTDVSGVSHAECNELQPPELQPLDPGQLCAGGDKGKDACKGDSGGPLMVTLINNPPGDLAPTHVTYQIGVVSYGPDSPCGTAPLPSIYTRVSSYVPWITSTLRP